MLSLGAWLFGIPGAIAGYIAGNMLPAIRMLRLLRTKPSVGQALRRQVIRFAVPSWATAVIGGLVFGRTEIVFLQHYTGVAAVGLFAAAATIAEVAVQFRPCCSRRCYRVSASSSGSAHTNTCNGCTARSPHCWRW